MKRSPMHMITTVVVSLSLGMVGLACQSNPFEVSPNPPDFRRLPPERVRGTMWMMAAEVNELERVLGSADDRSAEAQRALVGASLDRLRVAAGTLEQPGRSSQHPVIDQHLGEFLGRLRRARQDVERDPPRYYLASTVAGACFVCHGTPSASTAMGESAPDVPAGLAFTGAP